DDRGGRAVVAGDAEIEVVGVRQDPDLRLLGGRRSLIWLALAEGTDGPCAGPGRLIENAVQMDLRRGPDGRDGGRGRLLGRSPGRSRPRAEHGEKSDEPGPPAVVGCH